MASFSFWLRISEMIRICIKHLCGLFFLGSRLGTQTTTHSHRNTKLFNGQHFVLLGTAYAAALYVHHGFSNSIRSQIILYMPLFPVSLLAYKTIVICYSILSKSFVRQHLFTKKILASLTKSQLRYPLT